MVAGWPRAAKISDLASELCHDNKLPIAKSCTMLGISKPTSYAYVQLPNGLPQQQQGISIWIRSSARY